MSTYQRLLDDIHETAIKCGRDPTSINLVAVTKNVAWPKIQEVYKEGCRNFGESKVQEALSKIEDGPRDIDWHMIGTLQKNKVSKIVGKVKLIHSIDNLEIAKTVSDYSQKNHLTSAILLQVNTSQEKSKHGFLINELLNFFSEIEQLPNIEIKGFMTMAPFVEEERIIRQSFAKLRELRDKLEPSLPYLSMGMSHDYRIAIQEGSTILRIGSAIFGEK